MSEDLVTKLIGIAILLVVACYIVAKVRNRILMNRTIAQRSELMRRIAGCDDYDAMLFRIDRVELLLHFQALKKKWDPWELYHPDIRKIMNQDPKEKVVSITRR